jgi:diguanylate cyclase (GGDEF)-like protein/PAS domain S-box-containing protein
VSTVEDEKRARIERASVQLHAVLGLNAVDSSSFEARLQELLRVDAETLEVARVSYWSVVEEGEAIRCEALFLRDERTYESGLRLSRATFPDYFRALDVGALVVADDAHAHPATRAFSDGYLKPAGIGAMLDTPVCVRGSLVGVVCHEHVGGKRTWRLDEQVFAISIGQLLSLAIEVERRLAVERELRESEERFRALFDVAPIPMLVLSHPEGRCLRGNHAASELSGVAPEDMVGHIAPEFYANVEERDGLVATLASAGGIRNREVELKRLDGSRYWATLSIELLPYAGQPAALVALMDVTERRRREEDLRRLALHDGLTGLANRTLMYDLMGQELDRIRAQATDQPFAVLFVDLDDFKRVNDVHGHEVGDALLRSVAARLRGSLRASDVAARIGGDEFIVLLPSIQDAVAAHEITDRLADALSAPHVFNGTSVTCSASIGLVIGTGAFVDVASVVAEADAAMYEAKQRGKARWVSAEPR